MASVAAGCDQLTGPGRRHPGTSPPAGEGSTRQVHLRLTPSPGVRSYRAQ